MTAAEQLLQLIHEAATVPIPADLDNDAAFAAWEELTKLRLEAIRYATARPVDAVSVAVLRERIADTPVTYRAEGAS